MIVYVLIERWAEYRDIRGVYTTEATALAAAEVCKAEPGTPFGTEFGLEPHTLDDPPKPFV